MVSKVYVGLRLVYQVPVIVVGGGPPRGEGARAASPRGLPRPGPPHLLLAVPLSTPYLVLGHCATVCLPLHVQSSWVMGHLWSFWQLPGLSQTPIAKSQQ